MEKIEEEQVQKKASSKYSGFYEWIDAVVAAFIAIFFIFTFCFRVVGVSGSSMCNTLQNGDWLIVSNFNYHVQRNDIIVDTQPNPRNEPLIKRVIGIGGDVININPATHEVTVNGIVLDEPYIAHPTAVAGDIEYPVTVPQGKVFVMGDNRNKSWDSRYAAVGFIDENYLMGKAVYRIYPFGDWKVN